MNLRNPISKTGVLALAIVLFGVILGLAPKKHSNDNQSKTKVATSSPIASRDVKTMYIDQLKIWCDGALSQQATTGDNKGGIYCKACDIYHGRSADAIYPLLTLYDLTKDERYRKAALELFDWSEKHISQPDGSWINEPKGKNPWQGITCFSTIALGEAIRLHGISLSDSDKKRWLDRLRKGADFLMSFITLEIGDVNYPISTSASLAISYTLLGDEKYLTRAKELANFGLKHFTENNLIWGEGPRAITDVSPRGFRPIDVPYNIEESLPNLALYAELTHDEGTYEIVEKSMLSHLEWMLPDGSWDAGWCARQYKWCYWGSATTDGCIGGFGIMHQRDPRFTEAAIRNLELLKTCTFNGVIYGGMHLHSRGVEPCIQHTLFRIKGLATALDADIRKVKPVELPSDNASGVRLWGEAGVLQIAFGNWRASITTNDIPSSKKRAGYPSGGALSMLWNVKAGPLCVASMNDYHPYEPSNMQKPNKENEYCLTPRVETERSGKRYSNIYDRQAKANYTQSKDSITVTIHGNLCDREGLTLPGEPSEFEITYTFTNYHFRMKANAKAENTILYFPVVSTFTEVLQKKGTAQFVVKKENAVVQVEANNQLELRAIPEQRVFNFVPGFEAIPFEGKIATKKSGQFQIGVR